MVETHFLLHIIIQNWNFPPVFSNKVSNCVLSSLWYIKVLISYRPFSCWNIVFYVPSWSIVDFENNEASSFIVSALFFHMSINILQNFFFISWILLKIMSLTAVPKTRFFFWPLLYFDASYFILIDWNDKQCFILIG